MTELQIICADCGKEFMVNITEAEKNDHEGNFLCYPCYEKWKKKQEEEN
jgi:formylmethanofuran dehydrogenase subunit E